MDREVKVATEPLSRILDRNMPKNTRIDILTIDVEGFDYEVLRSNDWDRYSPDYVLIECLGTLAVIEIQTNPIARFLADRRYGLVAKTANTTIFKLDSVKPC
jgi:hypothetical protein